MGMGWFPDFCLACDRQTNGGTYCSQACRLTDLERGSASSEPTSPVQPVRLAPWSSSSPDPSPSSASPMGFYLPPPVDFAAFRHPRSSRHPCAAPVQSPPTAAYPMPEPFAWHALDTSSSSSSSARTDRPRHPAPSRTDPADARMTPSSSQTSLASLRSTTSSVDESQLSDKVRTALRDYARSFDRTRDLKQRFRRT